MASGSDGKGKKERMAQYGRTLASRRTTTPYTSNPSSSNFTPF